ncbi:MAG: formate dehydrogenase [Azospirillum sp.]|nr:formate dehydrogenase [Azospirillum sp.]
MIPRVYVPGDSAALSVGADRVARAIAAEAAQRGVAIELVRNGSRGLFFLEPLVEVETAHGRVAYGPVAVTDISALFDAGFLAGHGHALAQGPSAEIPWLSRQTRLTLSRLGLDDPLSPEAFQKNGGMRGLGRALAMTPAAIVEAVTASGLRGRGGAGFPAGIKWRTVAGAVGARKYVVCNADEGDSGTFADRLVLEGDPFMLIEGMIIAGLAVGAAKGFVYIRSEYPHGFRCFSRALEIARAAGWLGPSVAGSGYGFEIEARLGAGAYICGEETALLESLEGRRGLIRAKPPLPAVAGLFGQPTLVNNVLTLAAVSHILADGAAGYAGLGTGRSRGTLTLQLGGNVKRGGLYELPFGLSLREVVYGIGGGTRSGRPVRAVQVGGPLGAYLPDSLLDTPLDYEALAAAKGLLGHGGVVVFDDTVDMAAQARFAFAFCARESCGKCTPCRIGAVRGVEVIDRIVAGQARTENRVVLDELCQLMTDASLCAMGGLTPLPVQSALTHFPEDFERPVLGAAAE